MVEASYLFFVFERKVERLLGEEVRAVMLSIINL